MNDPIGKLTDQERQAFREIADGITDNEANKLLNHHLGKTRRWMKWCAGNGYSPSLSDLVRQLLTLRIPRGQLTVTLAAALWRLAKREERDDR